MMFAKTPMPAARRSVALRSQLVVARAMKLSSRGQQFRQTHRGEPVDRLSFADVAGLPEWLSWSQTDKERLAMSVAILRNRPAIDQELSGAKLGALAHAIGRDLFDELCNAKIDPPLNRQYWSNKLPRPEDLRSIGEALIYSSLPEAFSSSFPGAIGDVGVRNLVTLAIRICTEKPIDVVAA